MTKTNEGPAFDRAAQRAAEKAQEFAHWDWAHGYLTKLLPPGSQVWTLQSKVSRTGMRRYFRVFAIEARDGQAGIEEITGAVAAVRDGGKAKRTYDGIAMNGCGYDAGHEIVQDLSLALHGKDAVDSLIQRRL